MFHNLGLMALSIARTDPGHLTELTNKGSDVNGARVGGVGSVNVPCWLAGAPTGSHTTVGVH